MVKPVIDEFIGNLNESLESLELNPYEIIEGGDDEFFLLYLRLTRFWEKTKSKLR